MNAWDPTAFKTLLRTTSQRLGQLQERKDARGQLTRRDIATCLAKGQLALARVKAAAVIQEDVMGDLLEELEMHVGVVGSHVGELGGAAETVDEEAHKQEGGSGAHVGKLTRSLSPVLVEAAASIIRAAPGTDSKDLNVVREVLIQRLGTTFSQVTSASENNPVSPRIMQLLSSPSPTAAKMDAYLVEVAHTYDVKWAPEPRREELIGALSEILRVGGGSSSIVDLPRLREACARGLPDDPPWVRPRTWRLLFGTLPNLKTTWARESLKQRDSYYDLVRRLLTPLASLPAPTTPLTPTDALISRISDSLFRVSPDLFALLGNEPQSTFLGKCPLDPAAPDSIPCASNLDKRLSFLKRKSDASETPEIRLDSTVYSSDPPSPPPSSRRQRRPTLLLPSKECNAPPAHRAHLSALLRLLYIHSTLNPAIQSPHVPWLLVPLYSAFVGETDEENAAHAEADTFWVFEALVGEIAEMEEEEGGKIWTRKLSERIRWADGELATSLPIPWQHTTGLDPIHPHYSYRWLAPLLAQTLPLPSVFLVWDVLFACPMRTRDTNSKLEYLVDICTVLLVQARTPLFRLGKPGQNIPGLWTQDHATLRPPSPLRPWELSDAFTQGIALLTTYPIDAAGGIDRVLQIASDLAQKRIEAKDKEKEKQRGSVGLGARITRQMWRGFTNQVTDGPEGEEEEEEEEEEEDEGDDEKAVDETREHDDGNETETPAAPTLTSRLANTVWRGITNQSSMEDEVPSPPSPQSPIPEDRDVETPTLPSQTSLWNYAGKLKDSDAVAAFSKVSSNWRAKALDAWNARSGRGTTASPGPVAPAQSTPPSAVSELAPQQSGWPGLNGTDMAGQRRGSLPGTQRESEHASLDPPRPAFFRSPRESFLPQPRRQHATAPPSPNPEPRSIRDSNAQLNGSSSPPSFIHRAGTSLASLATLPLSNSTPKNVPRPLMLSSRTNKSQQLSFPASRSEGGTPEYHGGTSEWGEVLLAAKTRHALRQGSVSSTSSISPSESMHRSPYLNTHAQSVGPRSDHESDGSAAASRKVPLNRKSISPMALASRSPALPWNATSPSAGGRNSGHPLSNRSVTAEDIEAASAASERGWRHFDAEERGHPSTSAMASTVMAGSRTTTTGFDSPTTIASPPIPRTPPMPPVSGPGIVRIANGGHVATSSISTLSETSEVNVTAPSSLVRKKTPPHPGTSHPPSSSSPEPTGESELELERTPSGKAGTAVVKLRSKRYVLRPGHLRVRTGGFVSGAASSLEQQRAPSPGQPQRSLAAPEEGESVTPKVASYSGTFGDDSDAGVGMDVVMSRPEFVRKPSKEARLRKVSSTGMRDGRRIRDSSAAEEGDDEGYGDLLSAYESEEGSRE